MEQEHAASRPSRAKLKPSVKNIQLWFKAPWHCRCASGFCMNRTSKQTRGIETEGRVATRRAFLKRTGEGLVLAMLMSSLPKGWAGSTVASDAPETPDMRFGIIALTDCSPLVIAHEKGFFKKFGIKSTIVKGASWAAIRDNLSTGDIQGTHMLLGMPLASTMGLAGSPKKPMVIPWLLNRNGQAITLQAKYKGTVKAAADFK